MNQSNKQASDLTPILARNSSQDGAPPGSGLGHRASLKNSDGESENDASDAASDSGKPSKRQKRSRACEACRGMKIRCIEVPGSDTCAACSKVNRTCIMPGPARKRQKTVHKVAELEKKIDALTTLLAQRKTDTPSSITSPPDLERHATASLSTAGPTNEPIPEERIIAGRINNMMDKNTVWQPLNSSGESDWLRDPGPSSTYVDAIDKGLITASDAYQAIRKYRDQMVQYTPVVCIPSTMSPEELRRARPMVFLAIVGVACPSVSPSQTSDIIVELTRQLSDRIMFLGEKSLELVQALLIYSEWYNRSKVARDLGFNLYIHAAVVICLDLGMGRRSKIELTKDPVEDLEIRRTWLACFHMAKSVATLLRHPALLRFSPYVEECLDVLSQSPHAAPSDPWLCHLVRLTRINEDCATMFFLDDPASNVSLNESKTNYHLKTFSMQLRDWKESAPPSSNPFLVEHLCSAVSLYSHEIAIHQDHNIDDFRPMYRTTGNETSPTSLTSSRDISSARIDALTTCLESAKSCIDAFLKIDLDTARILGNLHLVWNTYALVALIRLQTLFQAPDSRFANIFPEINAFYYLEAMQKRLSEMAKDQRCPGAEAFTYVVRKLKAWYKHKQNPDGVAEVEEANAECLGAPFSVAQKGAFDRAMEKDQQGLFSKWTSKDSVSGPPPQPEPALPPVQLPSWVQPGTGSSGTLRNAWEATNLHNTNMNMGVVANNMTGASSNADYADPAIFDAQNWNDFSMDFGDLDQFDVYMNDTGWMSYLM